MDKLQRERVLAEEPILPLFIRFALPAVIGMIVQALYNIVDRFYIGNLEGVGKIAIGGIGVVMPILFILMGFSMLYGIGAGANISIRLGQKNMVLAERVLGNAFAMLFYTGLVLNLVFLFNIEALLKLFGATSQNLSFAHSYLRIILIGNFWNNFAFALNHMMRSEGNLKRAMFSMLIGAGLNIILDPILIWGFNLGVAGAAYATIIAQLFSFLWGASYYWSKKSLVTFYLKNIKIDFNVVFQIIAIGFSPFFMQIANSLVGAILNNSLKIYGGTLAQGAYTIINAIAMLFFMPVFAMNQALQPIIGYNYGAGDYSRVKKANMTGIIAATTIMLVGWLCIQLFTKNIISFMAKDDELIEITTHGIRIFLFAMPFIGMQIINANFFQSIGKAKIAFFLSLSRQLIFLVPFLLILPRFMGLDGIWYAIPIADILSFVLALVAQIIAFRNLSHFKKAT